MSTDQLLDERLSLEAKIDPDAETRQVEATKAMERSERPAKEPWWTPEGWAERARSYLEGIAARQDLEKAKNASRRNRETRARIIEIDIELKKRGVDLPERNPQGRQ